MAGNTWSNFYEGAAQNMRGMGEKFSQLQDYLVNQLRLADCCNNVHLEPSMTTNLQELSNQGHTLRSNGIARPSEQSGLGSIRGTVGASSFTTPYSQRQMMHQARLSQQQ